jgi:hypothetical protein
VFVLVDLLLEIIMMGREFGVVVRAAEKHAGDPGSIPGRDGLYTFGCIPQRFESASAEILRYIKTLIYFIYFMISGMISEVDMQLLVNIFRSAWNHHTWSDR